MKRQIIRASRNKYGIETNRTNVNSIRENLDNVFEKRFEKFIDDVLEDLEDIYGPIPLSNVLLESDDIGQIKESLFKAIKE